MANLSEGYTLHRVRPDIWRFMTTGDRLPFVAMVGGFAVFGMLRSIIHMLLFNRGVSVEEPPSYVRFLGLVALAYLFSGRQVIAPGFQGPFLQDLRAIRTARSLKVGVPRSILEESRSIYDALHRAFLNQQLHVRSRNMTDRLDHFVYVSFIRIKEAHPNRSRPSTIYQLSAISSDGR